MSERFIQTIVKLRPVERAALVELAQRDGQTLAGWLRQQIHREARQAGLEVAVGDVRKLVQRGEEVK
jgi:hypothetical protein